MSHTREPVSKQLELDSVADSIEVHGFQVGAVRVRQAIRELDSLEQQHSDLQAICRELVEAAESYLGAADPCTQYGFEIENKLIDTLNKARGKL